MNRLHIAVGSSINWMYWLNLQKKEFHIVIWVTHCFKKIQSWLGKCKVKMLFMRGIFSWREKTGWRLILFERTYSSRLRAEEGKSSLVLSPVHALLTNFLLSSFWIKFYGSPSLQKSSDVEHQRVLSYLLVIQKFPVRFEPNARVGAPHSILSQVF